MKRKLFFLFIIFEIFSCEYNKKCDSEIVKISYKRTLIELIPVSNLIREGYLKLGYIEFPFNLKEDIQFKKVYDNPCLHYENIKLLLFDKDQPENVKIVGIYSMAKLDLDNYYDLIDIVIDKIENEKLIEVLLEVLFNQDIKFEEILKDKKNTRLIQLKQRIRKINPKLLTLIPS